MTGFLDKLDLSQSAPAIFRSVLELWREYQAELAENGVSDRAKQLELDVWQAMQMGRHAAGGEDPPTGVREPSTTTVDPVGCLNGEADQRRQAATPRAWLHQEMAARRAALPQAPSDVRDVRCGCEVCRACDVRRPCKPPQRGSAPVLG